MKKSIFTLFGMLLSILIFAQSPEGFKYQAVVRNTTGAIVPSQAIGMQVRLRQGTSTGTPVYEESFTPTSNAYGLVNMTIGAGTVSLGTFAAIDWGAGPYFVEIGMDITGGTAYTVMGTSQLMSVPYALYAKTAANAGVTYTSGTGISITGNIIDNTAPDQTVTILGTGSATVSGTYPNFTVNSTDNVNDADADPSNEIQTIAKAGNTVTLSNSGGSFTDAVNDADFDSTNELQVLNISNDTIYLSNGGYAKLPAGFDGQYSSLTGAPTNVSTFNNDSGYLTSEGDSSITNEIQTLSLTGNDLAISGNGGNTVRLHSRVVSVMDLDTIVAQVGEIVYAINGAYSEALMWNGTYWMQLSDKCYPQPQTANAGANIYSVSQVTVSLNANSLFGYETGTWSIISGTGGTFSNPNNYNSTFTGNNNEAYTLRWSVTTACSTSYDDVNVYIGNVIGQYKDGGVIFYVDGTGAHGFVCTVDDNSVNGNVWGCIGTAIGTTGTVVGTGAQNTMDIEVICTTSGTAADLCANLNLNGFSDWFLPSKDELTLMFQQKNIINTTAVNNGGFGTGFSGSHWSSSEYDTTNAWNYNGFVYYYSSKSQPLRIRAIRAF